MDFFELVKTGTPQDVQAAISNGANVNVRGKEFGTTPLMGAAEFNSNPEVITTLLKAGANVDFRDKDGWTALMGATVFNPNPEVITALLAAGADAKAKDNEGKMAFDYAQTRAKLKDTDAYRRLEEASR
jgi:ankyrin repeat protein